MPDQKFENIEFNVSERIAHIIFNRPQALNALDENIASELLNALELCNEKEIRAVIISGKGKAFSSGGDIKMMMRLDEKPSELPSLLEKLNKIVTTIRNLEKPVIAAINGFAMGAGLGLALACDFRIVGKNSSYSCAFINIGLVPDTGASYFITRLTGYSKALELMLTGDTINSDQALSFGLVNRVVDDNETLLVARKFAQELSKKPSEATGRIKKMVNKALISDLPDQLSLEAFFQSEVAKTEDFKEGIKAFAEKRKPVFK